MLSRTADNLYWIARYMERADTVARLLEVGSRISLLPSAQGYRSEWDSLLPVSYTHLDVYKRQAPGRRISTSSKTTAVRPAGSATCWNPARS